MRKYPYIIMIRSNSTSSVFYHWFPQISKVRGDDIYWLNTCTAHCCCQEKTVAYTSDSGQCSLWRNTRHCDLHGTSQGEFKVPTADLKLPEMQSWKFLLRGIQFFFPHLTVCLVNCVCGGRVIWWGGEQFNRNQALRRTHRLKCVKV